MQVIDHKPNNLIVSKICIREGRWCKKIWFMSKSKKSRRKRNEQLLSLYRSGLASWHSCLLDVVFWLFCIATYYQSTALRWVWAQQFFCCLPAWCRSSFRETRWIQESIYFSFAAHELVKRTWQSPLPSRLKESFKWHLSIYIISLVVSHRNWSPLEDRLLW